MHRGVPPPPTATPIPKHGTHRARRVEPRAARLARPALLEDANGAHQCARRVRERTAAGRADVGRARGPESRDAQQAVHGAQDVREGRKRQRDARVTRHAVVQLEGGGGGGRLRPTGARARLRTMRNSASTGGRAAKCSQTRPQPPAPR